MQLLLLPFSSPYFKKTKIIKQLFKIFFLFGKKNFIHYDYLMTHINYILFLFLRYVGVHIEFNKADAHVAF